MVNICTMFNGNNVTLDAKSYVFDKLGIIMIDDLITSERASQVVCELEILKHEKHSGPLHIYLNTDGGEISEGKTIIDSIYLYKKKTGNSVYTHCIGKAYSMGAVIFAISGDKRYVYPNSELMLHQPSLGTLGGKLSDLNNTIEHSNRVEEQIYKMLSERTGMSFKTIKNMCSQHGDNFISPQEAIQLNLADYIEGED